MATMVDPWWPNGMESIFLKEYRHLVQKNVARDTLQFSLQSSTICLGSLKNSNTLKTGASAAIVLRKMYVTRQLVNAANVNLDSLEAFAQVNNISLWK